LRVNENVPSVTVIIAARPGLAEIKAVAASRSLDYPPEKLEIIVTRGQQPSVQRNAAMRAARGDWIYFLDDDSVPQPGNLSCAGRLFGRPEVKMVGGPNVCPPGAPPLEQVFALVLASWLAFGPSRARYAPVGATRETSEKELILCNLLARRDAMLELGGFNEALYPNEENALMDELQKRGGKLIYDPQFLVHRRPRSSLKSFARMLKTYGRGRAEQFRLHPTAGSALNFVPPLFCVYLVVVAVWVVLGQVRAFGQVGHIGLAGQAGLIPLVAYGVAVLAQAAALALGRRAEGEGFGAHAFRSLAASPLIVLSHILYGFGFWRGLFTTLKPPQGRPPVRVVLETIKHLGSPSA
jgi:succinoglycan biosynthesis protein ExoA